jgi:hypothetical protein
MSEENLIGRKIRLTGYGWKTIKVTKFGPEGCQNQVVTVTRKGNSKNRFFTDLKNEENGYMYWAELNNPEARYAAVLYPETELEWE